MKSHLAVYFFNIIWTIIIPIFFPIPVLGVIKYIISPHKIFYMNPFGRLSLFFTIIRVEIHHRYTLPFQCKILSQLSQTLYWSTSSAFLAAISFHCIWTTIWSHSISVIVNILIPFKLITTLLFKIYCTSLLLIINLHMI